MCQILYLIAEACLAAEHMLLEINTHDTMDTNYKTTGACRHILSKLLRVFFFFKSEVLNRFILKKNNLTAVC